MVRSPWFPLVLQGITLLGMGYLAWAGWGVGVGLDEEAQHTMARTGLTTLVIWGLWWPAMIIMAVLLGRVWCLVCPMELVNRLGLGLGRRLGSARLKIGRFLRAGWAILLAYLLLQILVVGANMHGVPAYTSWMLLAMGLLAFGSGLLLREGRSFCKAFCPAQALLSVYGRHTPLQLDKKDDETCASCTTHECVQPNVQDRMDARSCPSNLRPFDRQASDGCVLCLQCVKVCPNENMSWGLASSEAGSLSLSLLKPFEAGFVMVVAGFLTHELLDEVPALDGLFHAVPRMLNHLLPTLGFAWFEALWFLLAVPVIFWSTASALAYALGYRGHFKHLLLAAATGAAPMLAVAHFAKATFKFGEFAGFLPYAAQDPSGLGTLSALAGHVISEPKPLLSLSLVGGIMTMAFLIMGIRAFNHHRGHVEPHMKPALRSGWAVAGLLFLGVLAAWVKA